MKSWSAALKSFSLALALVVASISASAAEQAQLPDRREIYVPTRDLKTVLAAYPRAVLLSREQYETLLRDAKTKLIPTPEPPQRAVFSSARYTGELAGNVLDVHAEFTVHVLSDQWAELSMRLGPHSLGNLTLDGSSALDAAPEGARLLICGKGEHKISAEFMVPVMKERGVNSLRLNLPKAAAGLFTLTLPPDTQVDCSLPVDLKKSEAATVVSVALGNQDSALLTWRASGDSHLGSSILFQENSLLYSIDETKVQADCTLVLNSAMGPLPVLLKIKIPPDATPLHVEGVEVLKWNADEGLITVELTPGDRKSATLHLLLESPSLAQDSKKSIPLPVPQLEGVRRASGKFAVIGNSGLKIKEITSGDLQVVGRLEARWPGQNGSLSAMRAVQTEGLFESRIEQDPQFIAGYRFDVQPETIQVAVEKVTPRVSADLDTLMDFKREAIFVHRTLALSRTEGDIFESNLVMPEGEELISIRTDNGSEPDWKADGRKIKIRWNTGLGDGQRIAIQSRIDPPKWPESDSFAPGDLKVEEVEKINGYLAVKADDLFRLETLSTRGLEPRDGRTTPVKGDFAWFRREGFELQLKLARRASELQATLLGYALPLDGALDLHGQLNFNILYSGIKKLRIKVPAESAAEFHFEGADIAERNREGDTWTIVLQKEITGRYPLKFQALIPYDPKPATFRVAVPQVEPLDAKQQTGTWAIEADTSTEISFKTNGMHELDPLHAPQLPDYLPQHHIIGIFDYLGAYSLTLEGVKHEAAPILTTVVDRLELNTVLSTSGAERHQAQFSLRTVGEQFLDVTLPESTDLWSLMVDGQVLKPVAQKPNVVRVQLPATQDRSRGILVQLLYETQRHEWGATGGVNLAAPKLSAIIPVLQSNWHLFLPEGFSYTSFDSNLRHSRESRPIPLALITWDLLKGVKPWILKKTGITRARQSAANQLDVAAQNARSIEILQNKLNTIILPKVEFHEATVDEAIRFLRQKTINLDSGRGGVKFAVKNTVKPSEARISLSLTDIPLFEAMRYIAYQAGLKIRLQPDGIQLVPLDDPDPMVTKDYYFPIGTLEKASSVRGHLESQGVTFGSGATATYTPYNGRLVLHNTVEQQQLVDAIRDSLIQPAQSIAFGMKPDVRGTEGITKRLNTIIIPKMVFHEASIKDAINFLRQKSKEVDPTHEGVNLVLKWDGLVEPSTKPGENETRITLSLTDIPLFEALRYITYQANLKVKIDPYAVSIVPMTECTDVLVTKEYRVPPGFMTVPELTGDEKTSLVTKNSSKDFLESQGVVFPDGASANFMPTSGRLIVRNTQTNLDLIDSLVDASAGAPPSNRQGAFSPFGLQSSESLSKARKTIGLLPMKLELAPAGQEFFFQGFNPAENLEFHYIHWWNQARRGWIGWVLGGIAFFALGRFGAFRRIAWGLLILTFLPLCVASSLTGPCNALLVGWVTAFLMDQMARRLVFREPKVEGAAQ